jgi:hypothetical protein
MKPVEDLLQNHRQLENGQNFVVAPPGLRRDGFASRTAPETGRAYTIPLAQ